MMKQNFVVNYLSLCVCSALMSTQVTAGNVSQTDFGGVGLLQTPTARMAKTGEFSANYRDNDQYRRWSLSVQPFDWLETTLRYTDIRTRDYGSESFSGDQTYKDKAIDAKIHLWDESTWLPETALGFRDFVGTGLFDSEYLVTSKRVGPLDFSLGMGFGNMAESGNISNPFCKLASKYCTRSENTGTGNFEANKFFHGPAALFGGIEYQTPWQPLRLKVEYDGNDYSNEPAGQIRQSSPINVGLVYQLADAAVMSLSYERGNTFMWGITLRTNLNDLRPIHYADPAPEAVNPSGQPSKTQSWREVASNLEQNAGYANTEISRSGDQVIVSGEQQKYRDQAEATDRTAAIIANQVTPKTTTLLIQNKQKSLSVAQTTVDLNKFRQAKTAVVLGDESPDYAQSTPTEPAKTSDLLYRSNKDPLEFNLSPSLTQSMGGAESFYMYQIGVNANTSWHWNEHFSTDSTVYLNALDNYDKFNYTEPTDSDALPRVRTRIREYVTSSNVLLNNLQFTEMRDLAPDWYGQAYAGYLEMMYAGAGSEVLYRPFGSAWAIGADANYVKQRDWDNTLKFADYSITTGHLTGYWHLPTEANVVAKVSVGRYLAGDYGTTVDLSRQFDSGVVIGAFATLTNVSSSAYGEGSFTKGVYFTIPLDLVLTRATVKSTTISWVPLTRDGGQMLDRKYHLYDLTNQ
jgi:hypothetical protein